MRDQPIDPEERRRRRLEQERICRQLKKLLGPLGFKEDEVSGKFCNGDAYIDPTEKDVLSILRKPADVIGYIYNLGWNRGREFTQSSIRDALGLDE